MSASSKPPRGTHSAKPPTADRVARVLLDAEFHGDREAARRHGIHYNTVKNWRVEWGDAPGVVAEMRALRAELRSEWLTRAKDIRARLLDRMEELALTSKNLTAVTNAARRTHEIVLSDEIIHDADDQHHGPDQPARQRPAEGPGGAEGPGEAPEG